MRRVRGSDVTSELKDEASGKDINALYHPEGRCFESGPILGRVSPALFFFGIAEFIPAIYPLISPLGSLNTRNDRVASRNFLTICLIRLLTFCRRLAGRFAGFDAILRILIRRSRGSDSRRSSSTRSI